MCASGPGLSSGTWCWRLCSMPISCVRVPVALRTVFGLVVSAHALECVAFVRLERHDDLRQARACLGAKHVLRRHIFLGLKGLCRWVRPPQTLQGSSDLRPHPRPLTLKPPQSRVQRGSLAPWQGEPFKCELLTIQCWISSCTPAVVPSCASASQCVPMCLCEL